MATLISDDGQIATFQTDDGRTVQVASQFAQPYIDPPLGAQQADPEPQLKAPDLSLAAQGAPQVPQDIGPALPAPAAPPSPVPDAPLPGGGEITMPAEDLRPPEQVPIAEPEVTFEPDPVNPAPPPPDITPQGPLNTPTQVAGALNADDQVKAESVYRQAEVNAGAAGSIVEGSGQLDDSLDRMQRQKAEFEAERERQAKLLDDDYTRRVEKYATWKADPNRGMSSDRQAWAWIGVALAGLGQVVSGRDPTNNPALDQLMAGVQQRIQLQMAERDALGEAVGMKRQEIADFRTNTRTRAGEFDLRMAAELERYARLVDRIKTRAGAEVEREAATQLAAQLRQGATQRKAGAIQTEASARARMAAARAAALEKQREAAEKNRKWMLEHGVVGIDPATGLYIKDPSLQQEDALKGREAVAKTTKAEADAASAVLAASPEERARTLGVGGLKRKDGTAVLARSAEEGAKLTKKKAATDTATRLIDEMIALRKRDGWSSDLLKSDEWRQIQVNFNDLKLTRKDLDELGVLAGPDMALIEGALGTADPTEVRDPLAGLEKSRANMVNKFNADLKANDPNAERYEPERLEIAKAVERDIKANSDVAFAPASDLAKSDPDEMRKLVDARLAAIDQIARQAPAPIVLRVAADRLAEQHAAGEITDEQYKTARAKLAKAALKLRAKTEVESPTGVTGVADMYKSDWQERALGGGK